VKVACAEFYCAFAKYTGAALNHPRFTADGPQLQQRPAAMSDAGKPERITFSPDAGPPESGRKASVASATGKGSRFRRSSQSSRDGDGRGLFMRSRTRTIDRDHEAGVYDEGFDAPRESDFRTKQIFHGWKLILCVSCLARDGTDLGFRLAYQSAGVIYGDIGTSPLYVFSSTFSSPPKKEDLMGALSIIIWSLILIVTLKYVCIVLNADNEGQGGTFAMYSLLTRYVRELLLTGW
jgi:hypothetical protein